MIDIAERSRVALEPTEEEIRQQDLKSNAKAAGDLLPKGQSILDIGCGDGKFTRSLTDLFATVTGVDVKEKSISKAKAAAAAEGSRAEFMVADGKALPFDDASMDAVVISNSLHHIPEPHKGLAEAARVLKPGGILYVMEPIASGHYHEATKVVNDETIVRREAYEAVLELASHGFSEVSESMYRQQRIFDSFEQWREHQIDRDEKRKEKFDADPEGVRDRFMTRAHKQDGKLVFDQVFRVNMLRKNA